MSRVFIAVCMHALWSLTLQAAEFHIDPLHGASGNDGSASRPWRSLQEVIDAGLVRSQEWDALPYAANSVLVPKHPRAPVQPGDTVWLHDGYYGGLTIGGHYNESDIRIAAAEGCKPRFRSIEIQSSAHWVLEGLHVSPEFGPGSLPRAMIGLRSHGWSGPVHDIAVVSCVLESAGDTSDWSKEDWNTRACNGIELDGTRMTIRENRLRNVDFGISSGASHALIAGNLVENFSGDGLRGLGNYSVFEGNTVKNCYDVNDNHDDGFQSWSRTERGVGTGEVVGVVLRGNTIINYEDVNQPHRGTLQGIGCFDGMFVDWVIENNVVIVDHYHGITLLGARGCRIVNNTVLDPNNVRPGPAAIRVESHKNGTASSACVVRNNLAPHIDTQNVLDAVVDHNLLVERPEEHFMDAVRYNLSLKETSPAIDAGTETLAPSADVAGHPRPQGQGVDVGAYEYTGK